MKPFNKDKFDKDTSTDMIAHSFQRILENLGADLTNDSIKETPRRVAKMFTGEIFASLFDNPPELMTQKAEGYKDLIIVKDIEVISFCEHHLVPFIGKATIAYRPNGKLVGLSKFNRVVEYFSRRPQVQERLTNNIFTFLSEKLGTTNIYVKIEAEHYCVKIRGVRDRDSKTITTSTGTFSNPDIERIERF